MLRWGRHRLEVHEEWRTILKTLRYSGRVRELSLGALASSLGASARQLPDPEGLTTALLRYYRDESNGPERVRADRWVVGREEDRCSARQIVTQLRLAAPELGRLDLVDHPRDGLLLRTVGVQAPLPESQLDRETIEAGGGRYETRTVSVRALVAATNALLAACGLPFRFLPLASAEGSEAFFGLELPDARLLDAIHLLDRPLERLRPFAGWDRTPMESQRPDTRRVA